MPSTGLPRSRSSVRSSGAPSEYTEAGPPERTSAAGRRSAMASSGTSCGRSSANTPHSRIRRAMSCEYCPPKSRTRTSSRGAPAPAGAWASPPPALGVAARASVIRYGYGLCHHGPAVRTHADRLLALELLALGLERRGDHDLGALEVADVLIPAGRHRGPQGPHQVEGAIVVLRRAEEDLLERAVLVGRDPGAARQRGVE